MNRLVTFLLILTVAAACAPVSAGASWTEDTVDAYDVEYYAYLDLETASPEMRQKILDARSWIIHQYSWVADGDTAYTVDLKTGEIIEKLPEFSTLFPGWDLPIVPTEVDESLTAEVPPDYVPPDMVFPEIKFPKAEAVRNVTRTPTVGVDTSPFFNLGVRASTFSTPGWSIMYVFNDRDIGAK